MKENIKTICKGTNQTNLIERFKMIGKDAETDWLFTIIVLIVIFLLTLVFNIYVFIKINEGEFFTVPKDNGVFENVVDRNRLKSVLDNFEQKDIKSEEIKAKTLPADPSI